MPRWQRFHHGFGFAFVCVAFTAMGIMNVRILIAARGTAGARAQIVVSILFLAFIVFGIGGQFWYRRRIIDEFSWEGRALRFHTLGASEAEIRDVFEINKIGDWRGRGGSLGYKIVLRDGRKYYLPCGIPNAPQAAAEIRDLLITRPR